MQYTTDAVKYQTWKRMKYALITGILMVATISFYDAGTPVSDNIRTIISRFGCGLLIGGASLSAGGFMGFIFGIPSMVQSPGAMRVKYNDNLVQISDWLTKIIVGVGLTQIGDIPGKVMSLGEYLKWNFGGDAWARNASLAIVFYFLLFGFLMIYLWTRTDFTTIMKDVDDDLQAQLILKQNELDKVKEEIQLKENELEIVQTADQMKTEDIKALSETLASKKLNNLKKSEAVDPHKGKWGGKAEVNGRKVIARVRETTYDQELFNIHLEVFSTDVLKPLTGEVVFHVHPTFPFDSKTAKVINGKAELHLVAYGAFTVGIECDGGETQLEIDLAETADAPQLFRDR